jgi:hypothetical protein
VEVPGEKKWIREKCSFVAGFSQACVDGGFSNKRENWGTNMGRSESIQMKRFSVECLL